MRLVDADALSESIRNGSGTPIQKFFADVCVAAAKTVDAVPVVRCKNCIHYDMGVCLKIYSDGNVSGDAWKKRNPDDFCSYGEERNEK